MRGLGGLIARQNTNVDVGTDIIFADLIGPYVEKSAMAHPLQRISDRIDVAGVPVGGHWNTRIGASAVFVDPGDHPVITILEADINSVDIGSRSQRAIQQVVALVGTEILGIGGSHFGEKA